MNDNLFSSMHNRVMGTLILMAIFVSLGAYASLTFKQANHLNDVDPASISVNGTSEVFTKPDTAQFSFSVHGEGADASAAMAKSATGVNAITAALQAQGIDEKDVKTENYYLSQKYKNIQVPCIPGAFCPSQQTPDGFEVTQTISVKVRKIDSAGDVITKIGALGATDISNLTFTVGEVELVKAQARDLAITDAKAKAEKLAASLGVHLVRIKSFGENSSGGFLYAAPMADAAMEVKSAGAPVPAMPVGENKTVGNVTIVYEVK
jgi:uncharacterized protein